MNNTIGARTITIVLSVIILLSLILDILIKNPLVSILAFLVYFGCTIAVIVYSVKLIIMKDYAFGITFLILSGLFLLLNLLLFLVGFIIGFTKGLEAGLAGKVVSNFV